MKVKSLTLLKNLRTDMLLGSMQKKSIRYETTRFKLVVLNKDLESESSVTDIIDYLEWELTRNKAKEQENIHSDSLGKDKTHSGAKGKRLVTGVSNNVCQRVYNT